MENHGYDPCQVKSVLVDIYLETRLGGERPLLHRCASRASTAQGRSYRLRCGTRARCRRRSCRYITSKGLFIYAQHQRYSINIDVNHGKMAASPPTHSSSALLRIAHSIRRHPRVAPKQSRLRNSSSLATLPAISALVLRLCPQKPVHRMRYLIAQVLNSAP